MQHLLKCLVLLGFYITSIIAQQVTINKTYWEKLIQEIDSFDQQKQIDCAIFSAKEALRIARIFFSHDAPEVDTSLHKLAVLFQQQNCYAEAEALFTESLEIRERVLGPEHPDLLYSLNNLAVVLEAQTKYDEALTHFQRALKLIKSTPVFEDSITNGLLNNIAKLYQVQGHFQIADSLYAVVLKMQKTLKPEHPEIANTLYYLATSYQAQGRFAEAESLYLKSQSIRIKNFGNEHPSIAVIYNNLAMLYQSQNKYPEAKQFYHKALKIRKEHFNTKHPVLVSNINKLAEVCLFSGESDSAAFFYCQSLAVKEDILIINKLAELYISQKKFWQAESLYLRSLTIEKHLQTLNKLALLYQSQKKFSQAEPIFLQVINSIKTNPDARQLDLAQALDKLGKFYLVQENYTRADSLFQAALKIKRAELDSGDLQIATSNSNLGLVAKALGKFTTAENFFQHALSIKKLHSEIKQTDLLVDLYNLGGLQEINGKYAQAELLYYQALTILKQTKGENHPEVAVGLNNLATLYEKQGQFTLADSLYSQALNLLKQAQGVTYQETATTMNNLAALYTSQGKYNRADSISSQSLSLLEKNLCTTHPDLVISLNNRAELFRIRGQYAEAEPIYQRALSILENSTHPNYVEMAMTLNNLAILNEVQGKYSKAEELYQKVTTLQYNIYGSAHPAIAQSLNNLAGLQYTLRNFTAAESLYYQSKDILEKTLGIENFNFAACLNNLAVLYQSQNQFEKADTLYQKSLKIFIKVFGQSHPDIAYSLNNLASLAAARSQLSLADSLYRMAIQIQENMLRKNHPDLANSLNGLAVVLVSAGQIEEALPLMVRSLAIDDCTIENVFSLTSEQDKYKFLATISYRFEVLLSLTQQKLQDSTAVICACLDATLQRKGIVLDALSRERQSLYATNDSQILPITQQLQEICSRLATLTLAGPGERSPELFQNEIKNLENQKEQIENELARRSRVYATEQKIRKVDTEQVSELLPIGSVLVEFICPEIFNFNATGIESRWNESHYLAFILHAGVKNHPSFIDLGPADIIDHAIRCYREELAKSYGNILQLGEKNAELQLAEKAKRLYNLVFFPLKNALAERKTIFLAPDGDLNLVPFAALVDTKNEYLIENYQFNYLTSGRDLISFQSPVPDSGVSIIIVNPDYNLNQNLHHQTATNISSDNFISVRNSPYSQDLHQAFWVPLPGTKKEAEAIKQILADETTKLYLDQEATEDVVKNLHSPYRLHLATHGFFLETQEALNKSTEKHRGFSCISQFSKFSKKNSPAENPLLRSGLILAGANHLGKEKFRLETNDGVLTALEISGIPLYGTSLVVLSACETGIGETRRGEGVFGLRRAFQLAGVRTLVMSLWSVPDTETQQLMTNYYQQIKNGIGKSCSLQKASLALMQTRQQEIGAAHPFFWAAFVSVGEP